MPEEEFSFVKIPYLLWSQDMGDPRTRAKKYSPPREDVNPPARIKSHTNSAAHRPNPKNAASVSTPASSPQKFTSKLPEGTYFFDFSFELPTEATLPVWNGRSKEKVVYRLPQTFNEKHTTGNVSYYVELKLIKSGLLRADDK